MEWARQGVDVSWMDALRMRFAARTIRRAGRASQYVSAMGCRYGEAEKIAEPIKFGKLLGVGGRVGRCTCEDRPGLSVSAPFVWRCLTSPTGPERQHPLIEPDVRVARSRLSDHLHRTADAGAVHGAVSGSR